MMNFNERTNTLLYKNIPLTLYSRKAWCWLCLRGELETGTDYSVLTLSSSGHSSTSFSSWLGCLTVGHGGPKTICLQADSHAGILYPTNTNCNWNWPKPSVAPGYMIVWHSPASAVHPLIYIGASLDWRLGRVLIYNSLMYVLNIFCRSFRVSFVFVPKLKTQRSVKILIMINGQPEPSWIPWRDCLHFTLR